jgi:hypothetical protein
MSDYRRLKNIIILVLAIFLLLILLAIVKRLTKPRATEGFETETIPGTAHIAYGMDVFKAEDMYDKQRLTDALSTPDRNAVNMLQSQQTQRQYMMAVLNEKNNLALEDVSKATAEIAKAKVRLGWAQAHVERARNDSIMADKNLAQAIIMQTYTLSNQVSVDPSVIAKTAAAMATAIANVVMATEAQKSAKAWHESMKSERAALELELTAYTVAGAAAASAQMKTQQTLNIVKGYYDMSAESEYVHKKFYPYSTKASYAQKQACDAFMPVVSSKVAAEVSA